MEGFIDSGTTLSYFPKNIYQLFIASINKYCEKPSKCLRRDKSFIGWDKSQCFLKLPETEMFSNSEIKEHIHGSLETIFISLKKNQEHHIVSG